MITLWVGGERRKRMFQGEIKYKLDLKCGIRVCRSARQGNTTGQSRNKGLALMKLTKKKKKSDRKSGWRGRYATDN